MCESGHPSYFSQGEEGSNNQVSSGVTEEVAPRHSSANCVGVFSHTDIKRQHCGGRRTLCAVYPMLQVDVIHSMSRGEQGEDLLEVADPNG